MTIKCIWEYSSFSDILHISFSFANGGQRVAASNVTIWDCPDLHYFLPLREMEDTQVFSMVHEHRLMSQLCDNEEVI